MCKEFDLSVYLVTDRDLSLSRSLLDVVTQAVEGGVTMVQLREKSCSSLSFYQEAKALKELLEESGIPLIINDRVDIALAVGAGLHIGQSDLPYEVARKLMGDEAIIGLSVETYEDAIKANEMDVDYIGLSPVFDTQTKRDIHTPLLLVGVSKIAAISKHPMVGIGGIHLENVDQVIEAGADGVAVVSAIVSQKDIKQATQALVKAVNEAKNRKEYGK